MFLKLAVGLAANFTNSLLCTRSCTACVFTKAALCQTAKAAIFRCNTGCINPCVCIIVTRLCNVNFNFSCLLSLAAFLDSHADNFHRLKCDFFAVYNFIWCRASAVRVTGIVYKVNNFNFVSVCIIEIYLRHCPVTHTPNDNFVGSNCTLKCNCQAITCC